MDAKHDKPDAYVETFMRDVNLYEVAPPKTLPPSTSARAAGVSQLVLIIEDDPFVSGLLADVLNTAGYEVKATDSAFGASTLVRELQPSAVLLDIGLPFRPGTDLLDDLKFDPRTATIPVVVLSGLTESLTAERCALAAAVLAKPVDISRLLGVLLQACAQSPPGTDTA